MRNSKDIRKEFIDFFINKGHKFVPSSPVIPIDDPTLLFTNAGMNQFKDIFLGNASNKVDSAVNSQKCIRAGGKHNDLEEVGKDGYHHTFFEMLGNWSFGKYYKKEAILYAWELLTQIWKIDKSMLYATVHNDDKEAFELWKTETDIEHEHISMHGDKDNFWEMGETGPCGPCSEIHIDRGLNFCNKQDVEGHKCAVNGDCHRYIELWNLVFIQYKRNKDKSLSPLENKFVDTGAGFERLCSVLQNVPTNYDTDIFQVIIKRIAEISGIEYKQDDRGIAHRVIADHIRALSFAIADGGMPSNEGRGYVIRRILRRAARYGRKINLKNPFLYSVAETLINEMSEHYQELKDKRELIINIIKNEEEQFNQTLDNGLKLFDEFTSKLTGNIISGKVAFTLYDTYGFPLDLTKNLAEEKGFIINEDEFNMEMENQKRQSKNASNFKNNQEELIWKSTNEANNTDYEHIESEFIGYEKTSCETKIYKYANLNDNVIAIQLEISPINS
jgi:alanyl-tRNA synthetase